MIFFRHFADKSAATLKHEVQSQRFRASLGREPRKVEQLAKQLVLPCADMADPELSGGGEPLSVEKTTRRLLEPRQSVVDPRDAVREVDATSLLPS